MLAARNIVEVWVPDRECEAARNLSRAHEDCRIDLQRARQRLAKFLLRSGYYYDEVSPSKIRRSRWTQAHFAWLDQIVFENSADNQTYQYYLRKVREITRDKAELFTLIKIHARHPRWKERVDALKCLKGIDTLSAFAFVVEADRFSRFGDAPSFEAWTGLVPSENSSGERQSRGKITKAGNAHVRRLLVEAAWKYTRGYDRPKKLAKGQIVDATVRSHAAYGIRRLMRKRAELLERPMKGVVANTATARELAGWVWTIGVTVENQEALSNR